MAQIENLRHGSLQMDMNYVFNNFHSIYFIF